MEIGSFIEFQLETEKEYYSQKKDIARLNSGRAAIYHSLCVLGCQNVWLPHYQCDTVRNFLIRKGIKIKYYHINDSFTPLDLMAQDDEAIVLVNYYGVMSGGRMKTLAQSFKNVIIDNSQAFFCEPIENCMNVYSARKFMGVPDGAYVIGKNAELHTNEYEQCYSSDTSLFLLQRIEYGCEGKTYASRTINEQRIDSEDIMRMSKLTRTILDGTNYDKIISKRKENFEIAYEMFSDINKIDPKMHFDKTCVPMVYPLVVENDALLRRLLDSKHFQGHWWSYLLGEMPEDCFEYWISKYVIPITIDQRYGRAELEFIRRVVG